MRRGLAAALLLAAALAGCDSSGEEPAGRFVFSGDLATPYASRLFVIGADGRGLRKVTRGLARVGESDADWSPDGSRIVFDRTYDCAASLDLCSAIWVVNADGSGEKRLTSANAKSVVSAVAPTWSPDGRRIAYVLLNDRGGHLWVMDADGSAQRRVTRVGDAEEPAWAPDGRRLAFSHDGDLVVLDLNTGALLRLTRTPALFESFPDWSPDGEQIAYELNDESPPGQQPNQEYDAYVMRADGSGARRLSRPGDVDAHPVWSPDGEFIAYGSDVAPEIGDGIAIVIVDAGSGDLVRRVSAPGMDLYPIDWAADVEE